QYQRRQTGARQIGRGRQSIVAATDDDGVIPLCHLLPPGDTPGGAYEEDTTPGSLRDLRSGRSRTRRCILHAGSEPVSDRRSCPTRRPATSASAPTLTPQTACC